jgi:hypothetical protein
VVFIQGDNMAKLSSTRKSSIKSRMKEKFGKIGYKKGRVAETQGKKVSQVGKPTKKKAPTDLKAKFKGKTKSAGYIKAVKARNLARSAAKTHYAAGVKKGRKMSKTKGTASRYKHPK